MKRTILILVILTVGIVHSQAQIGAYYKTILNKYQQDIVESDSLTIVIEKDAITAWYLFEKGLCTDLYFTSKEVTKENLIKVNTNNDNFTKSSKGDWWYYYLTASNGKRYHVIVEIWHNKENKVFQHIYLNEEL